jgi:Galactose oxidase, central domain
MPSMPDRTKGMSVMLYSSTAPYLKIMVLGGSDHSNNNSYEIIDATSLSPTTNWGMATPFPDGEHRSLGSTVLLPDGSVFVCGGIETNNSPCALFNPRTNTWSAMAALPSIRDYHSVALLLPSGQVAMAGWKNISIEIFNPPYLYRGARPVISSAPSSVQRGQRFDVASPDAAAITSVVLARPMAVTHQTDTDSTSCATTPTASPPSGRSTPTGPSPTASASAITSTPSLSPRATTATALTCSTTCGGM